MGHEMGKDMGATTTTQHGDQAMGWMSELGPFLPGEGVGDFLIFPKRPD